jgi:copper transport protein
MTPHRVIVGVMTVIVMAAIAVASLGAAGPVLAQTDANSLTGSNPSDGATLGTSPAIMTFTFAQPVRADEAFTVAVGCGVPAQPQSTGIPQLGDDDVTFTVEVLSPFPRGACTITWLLRDELEQPIATDLIAFSVAADTPTATDTAATTGSTIPTAASAADTGSVDEVEAVGGTGGAAWLGHLLSTIAAMVLFGSAMLLYLAWPEGPNYMITQPFMIGVWVVGLVGSLIEVMAIGSGLTDTSFLGGLNPLSWFEVFQSGWGGGAAVVRLIAIIFAGYLALKPERVLEEFSQAFALGLPAVAVATLAFGRVAGSLVALGLVVNLLHVAAAALWFGGAMLTTRVVLAGPGDEDLVQAVRIFSRYSTPAILVTVVTGALETLRLVGGSLLTSSYGRVIILKVIAVVLMVFVAVGARSLVARRLARAETLSRANTVRFRKSFRAEASFGIVVLVFSGWAMTINPPNVSLIPDVEYAVTVPLADEAGGLAVDVSLSPGAVGLNAVEVRVLDTPARIVDLVLELDPAIGSYGRGVVQEVPLTGRGVARLGSAEGLPLDVSGDWTVTVTAVFETGLSSRLSSPLQVLEADGSVPTTSTTLVFTETTIVDPGAATGDVATTSVPAEEAPATTLDVTEVTTAPVVTVD